MNVLRWIIFCHDSPADVIIFIFIQKNEISKDVFVLNMRSIVGDQMLKIAVYKLHAQVITNQLFGWSNILVPLNKQNKLFYKVYPENHEGNLNSTLIGVFLKPNRENRLETRRLDPASYHHNPKLLHKNSSKKCKRLVPIREMFPSHSHSFIRREALVTCHMSHLLHHNRNLIQPMRHWARSHLFQFMEVQAIVIFHFLDLMLMLQPHLSNSNPMIHI